jgi:peptidoglycan-associated lipoprotein
VNRKKIFYINQNHKHVLVIILAVLVCSVTVSCSLKPPSSTAPIRFKPIYFAYDSLELNPGEKKKMQGNIIPVLKENSTTNVLIEGHTDERGTAEYNQVMGHHMANVVRNYLADNGIDPGRLTMISYGEDMPVDSGHDERAWDKNRRILIKMSSGGP